MFIISFGFYKVTDLNLDTGEIRIRTQFWGITLKQETASNNDMFRAVDSCCLAENSPQFIRIEKEHLLFSLLGYSPRTNSAALWLIGQAREIDALCAQEPVFYEIRCRLFEVFMVLARKNNYVQLYKFLPVLYELRDRLSKSDLDGARILLFDYLEEVEGADTGGAMITRNLKR